MSWEVGAAIAEIVSAIAVVITLIYLASQISQNTKAVRAAAVDSSVNHALNARQPLIEHADVMRIWLAGAENPDSLSIEDLFRYRLMTYSALMSLANVYAQSTYAELAVDSWEAQIPAVRRTLSTNGGKWFWTNYGCEFEKGFRQEVERIMQNGSEEMG